MAELVGVAGSVIAFAQASSTLSKLVKDFKQAPAAYKTLHDQMLSLEVLTSQTVAQLSLLKQDASLFVTLDEPLEKAAEQVVKVNNLLLKVSCDKKVIRTAWVMKRSDMVAARQCLEDARSALCAALILINT